MIPTGVRVFICGFVTLLIVGTAGVVADVAVADAKPVLTPKRVIIVGQATKDAPWRSGATEAKAEDNPRLSVVVVATERRGKRRRTVYVADDDIETLYIGKRKVKKRARRSWSDLQRGEQVAEVRWLTIEPNAWRNKEEREFHSNVSIDPETFGKWLGYDELSYFETEVAAFTKEPSARKRAASVIPSDPEVVGTTLGTIRYQAQVKLGDTVLSSPGKDATDRAGILPSVHRVSIRPDDSFVGHLMAYQLVPEVFGSAGTGRNHQSDRYTGADCADVLTGAARSAGMSHIKYTSVAGLTRFAKTIVKVTALDAKGMPDEAIKSAVVGDIIRINYGGSLTDHTPRGWDHVAVLVADRSDPSSAHKGKANGELDGFDLVIHMGHPRLVIEPLSSQAPATIDVLRWKKK